MVVTQGTMENDEGKIVNYLKENKALMMYVVASKSDEAKLAITHYQVIKKNEFYTLLEAHQETERKTNCVFT